MRPDQHAFHGLLHSAALIEQEQRRQLKPLGILPRQARVLEAIGRMGPVSQTGLASAFGVTSASMSTMTGRLLHAGLITRAVDPNSRRQNVVELTPRGKTMLDGICEAWSEVDRRIHEVLGKDAEAFLLTARRLRDNLGGKVPGAERAQD
ncbi:MarR family winged helix-turn-helix transcriptional regulator [Amaricoccus macauensis]|uniref:MarR family winged helix-turn-helix transcriptional regulator n=1 Tax=Amaricoccus macauensis TaxID=57001 RepID=UPI003C797603